MKAPVVRTVAIAVAVLLFVGGCGNDGSSGQAEPSASESPAASENPAETELVIAPGRIGPVEAGMTLEEAEATVVLEPIKATGDEPCPPPSLRWKAPNTNKLDLMDHDGKIDVLGSRSAEFKTEKGIGVDSTLDELKAAYPDAKVIQSPALGSLVYRQDGNKWLAIAFNEFPKEMKGSSKVIYLEVAVDEKPIAYPDGC
ncbi:MAG: hypothetical protein WAL70_02650 [Aeromicrobium sp.]